MKSRGRRATVDAWDPEVCNSLIDELWLLRASMLEYESRLEPWLRDVDPAHSASACNECVMLNKGPHILDAVRTLDDILRRMQTHRSKKRSLLRALKAWSPAKQAKVAPVRTRRSMIA